MKNFLLSHKTLVKAKEFIFPTDKEKTPQDHVNALLIVMSQHETAIQSDIVLMLKEALIKDRKDTIAELTADLEKLEKK